MKAKVMIKDRSVLANKKKMK